MTGAVEEIPWTAAFPAGQTFLTRPGMVSPVDGRIAAQGVVAGHPWPQTFVYDPRSGEVDLHGDPAATRDVGHVWSPDGRYVAFERHLATGGDGRVRIVRLEVGTGTTDTLYLGAAQESIEGILWLGADTLVLDHFAIPTGSEFLGLDMGTRHSRVFDEAVHWGGGPILAFSSTARWASRWTIVSISGTGQSSDSLVLSVRDRTTSDDWRRVRAIDFYSTDGSIAVVFSPDEAFVADCPAGDTVRISRLADLVEVERFHVPVCFALSWSRA
ncbi:MAG TPA: hypothetical protein VFN22_00285 [Gemmatimonadales bacterium]|nr:hypothetical protein [Gemmatimonadales bacterium]